MKKLIILFISMLFLASCTVTAVETEKERPDLDSLYYTSRVFIEKENDEIIEESSIEVRGIWVSQFDMKPIYLNGNKQRDKEDYKAKVKVLINNLKRDGFNTIFLQVRPNGDSMYQSSIFPLSKYVSGVYGGRIEYDVIDIFLNTAKENGLSVHAWINPFRLCSEKELKSAQSGRVYEYYRSAYGTIVKNGEDGILYLDPYYKETTELIVDGAKEILEKYDFDGIHIDDYFYPTEFELNDEDEFRKSGYTDKGQFRRDNISKTVKALYQAVHSFNGKVFSVSPAGNIYSLSKKWYADVYRWCSEEGYIDIIIPQLYFGFENAVCPFEKIIADWENAVRSDNVQLYIGLSAAKCVNGALGKEDVFAGEKGKYEWRDNKNILSRSLKTIINSNKADGFVIFTYSSFYDPLSGSDNNLITEEKTAFSEVLKNHIRQ